MKQRKIWRGMLAAAVAGVVEAAGLGALRPDPRRPLRVVWLDDREPADPLAGTGIWFLDPIGDPRPEPTDLRRPSRPPLRLARLLPLSFTRRPGPGYG